jgi:hypothetical protein
LTYQILHPKAARKNGKPPILVAVHDRDAILQRQLAATIFKVGDTVKFKKPKRNSIHGKVVEIQKRSAEVTWSSSGSPMNIVLEVEKKQDGIKYGIERVKANAKKLLLVEMGCHKEGRS